MKDESREEVFTHREHRWLLILPQSSDALISDVEFARDERLPYWADLWPSSKALTRHLLDAPLAACDVLEIGCGVGLASLAVHATGGDPIATDYEAEALRFATRNVAANGFGPLRTMELDWRTPPADLHADVVIGADVLYERRNAEAIAAFLPRVVRPNGRAILADPQRPWRATFVDALGGRGWTVTESATGDENGPTGRPTPIVLLICRPPVASTVPA
ncbi:MAG: methyltransferase domain-containing protein [Phycisphaerae bacterium]|nr:methyltransferase domain-containing protein [Phycisphaerae bacterium]